MPETEGLEVTMALHRSFPATRIIALSGGMADVDFLDAAVELKGPSRAEETTHFERFT